MRYWELMQLALGGIRRTPLRVSLTILGVAIATGLWVSLVGFCLGVQKRVEEPFQRLEWFNRMSVNPKSESSISASGGEKGEPAPLLDDAAVAKISRLPGVAVAYADLYLKTDSVQIVCEALDNPKKEKGWTMGLPRESGKLRYVHDSISAGRYFSPKRGPNEAVLGQQLAKRLGFENAPDAVGQTLSLKVSGLRMQPDRSFRSEQQQLEVKVVGIWDPARGGQFISTDFLILPADLIRELPGALSESTLDVKPDSPPDQPFGYRRVIVRVERPVDLFEVEEKIKAMGYETHNRLGELKDMREFFILMDLVWGAVGTVALIVAGLGIVNTMLMAVLERYREIGTYKALGASDGDIRLMFLAEAGLVGMLGGVLGLGLGRFVSWLCEIGFNAFARSKGIEEPMASHFTWQLLLSALGFAILVSLLSGVYPASRAARVDPIRALRSE